jgi:hypothetical protein
MKDDHMLNGQLKAAYNWQISTSEQFIVNYSLHQNPTDTLTLKPHLQQFETLYQKHPENLIADSGYGSQENYEYLNQNQIGNYVKYNYFHKEQKDKHKQNPFHTDNLYYNQARDKVYCPMGQPMDRIDNRKKSTASGFIQEYVRYRARNCHGCPLRGTCHKSIGNRVVEINHALRKYKKTARENLLSEQGVIHRKKRPADVEATFGIIKQNKGFRRFMLRGLDKVEIESGLLAIAHNLSKKVA